ncbi:unnamed protein product [Notodromas monacha]|uniref:Uncharacterized protein n=1 Tax=Notodromas monacha TaxID=399045 RepID=A0A7R9BU98_9CRUS|nr:unnamed protein product [Notodromas monacha]CAG0920484.1 unnamed protein product [Notodromas monacha]
MMMPVVQPSLISFTMLLTCQPTVISRPYVRPKWSNVPWIGHQSKPIYITPEPVYYDQGQDENWQRIRASNPEMNLEKILIRPAAIIEDEPQQETPQQQVLDDTEAGKNLSVTFSNMVEKIGSNPSTPSALKDAPVGRKRPNDDLPESVKDAWKDRTYYINPLYWLEYPKRRKDSNEVPSPINESREIRSTPATATEDTKAELQQGMEAVRREISRLGGNQGSTKPILPITPTEDPLERLLHTSALLPEENLFPPKETDTSNDYSTISHKHRTTGFTVPDIDPLLSAPEFRAMLGDEEEPSIHDTVSTPAPLFLPPTRHQRIQDDNIVEHIRPVTVNASSKRHGAGADRAHTRKPEKGTRSDICPKKSIDFFEGVPFWLGASIGILATFFLFALYDQVRRCSSSSSSQRHQGGATVTQAMLSEKPKVSQTQNSGGDARTRAGGAAHRFQQHMTSASTSSGLLSIAAERLKKRLFKSLMKHGGDSTSVSAAKPRNITNESFGFGHRQPDDDCSSSDSESIDVFAPHYAGSRTDFGCVQNCEARRVADFCAMANSVTQKPQ